MTLLATVVATSLTRLVAIGGYMTDLATVIAPSELGTSLIYLTSLLPFNSWVLAVTADVARKPAVVADFPWAI